MPSDWWQNLNADVQAICVGACPEIVAGGTKAGWGWAQDLAKYDWETLTRSATPTIASPYIVVAEPAWVAWPDSPTDENYQVGTLEFYYVFKDPTGTGGDPIETIREALNALEDYLQNPPTPFLSIEPLVSYGINVSAENQLMARLESQKIDYSAGCLSIQVDIPGPDTST